MIKMLALSAGLLQIVERLFCRPFVNKHKKERKKEKSAGVVIEEIVGNYESTHLMTVSWLFTFIIIIRASVKYLR